MKPLAIRPLLFALIAVWFAQSADIVQEGIASTAADPKLQYSDLSAHPDRLQVFLEYINDLEMMKVEAGVELQQSIEAIPVESGISLAPEQEAALRGWLYELLVAFSVSGSDSLVVAFYLREGVNNPDALKKIKRNLESWDLLKGDTPFDLFQAMHRSILDSQGYEYRFGNASFLHSAFKVSEMQGSYESYLSYAKTEGMVIGVGRYMDESKLKGEVAEALQAGKPRVFADIMFVVEEPEEFAGPKGQIRTPLFFRLVWDMERTMWRFIEVFYISNLPHFFQFSAM